MGFNQELIEFGKRIDDGSSLWNRLDSDRSHAKYTDLQIVCSFRVFNVHRVVLGTASEYFDAMLRGSFKEARTGVIDLTHVPDQHIELLLTYIYSGEYERHHSIATHIAMYLLADEYRMQSLKAKIIGRVNELLQTAREDVFGIIIEAVRLLWHNPAPEDIQLRRPVMDAAVIYQDDLMKIQAFRKLVFKGGDFVVKLLDGGYPIPWGGDNEPVEENLEEEDSME